MHCYMLKIQDGVAVAIVEKLNTGCIVPPATITALAS